jgi:FAD/FMN-containing dehydrogenase
MAGPGDDGGARRPYREAMTSLLPSPSDVEELRFRLAGDLHEPGTAGYYDACELFNAMVDKQPLLVARCTLADDVVAALDFARRHALDVAVRAGGHSVTGASLCDDGLVLDLRGMADVEVDAQRRIARVGGGATWADVDRAAHEHGLATTGGRVSTTGVVGLTLGGGSGWLERRDGLACDNLVAAELVTADGRLVRADADTNPDLLWALRGGGANFGVVTAIELALHPLPAEVFCALMAWPAHRAAEVLQAFRDVMHDAADPLSLAYVRFTIPDEEDFPAALRGTPGVVVAGLYAGPVAEGEAAVAALRALGPAADLSGPMAYPDFQCALDDPPGMRNWWTAEPLADLTPAAIEAIVGWCDPLPAGSQLFVAAWGGAVPRAAPGSSPLAGRDALFVAHPLLMWDDPAADDRMLAFGRAFRDVVAPYSGRAPFLNFIGDEGRGRVQAAYGEEAYARLRAIKAAWDPENVIKGNHALV